MFSVKLANIVYLLSREICNTQKTEQVVILPKSFISAFDSYNTSLLIFHFGCPHSSLTGYKLLQSEAKLSGYT